MSPVWLVYFYFQSSVVTVKSTKVTTGYVSLTVSETTLDVLEDSRYLVGEECVRLKED